MGRKSTIKQNPAIQAAVNEAISRGATVDAIKEMLDGMQAGISRSAVGRYTSQYEDAAARQRDISSAASAFASEFGDLDNNQTRFTVQLMTTIITENLLKMGKGEGDPMSLRLLAATVKDNVHAAKADHEYRMSVRRDALADAAKKAGEVAKAGGVPQATIDLIMREIMGIDD